MAPNPGIYPLAAVSEDTHPLGCVSSGKALDP